MKNHPWGKTGLRYVTRSGLHGFMAQVRRRECNFSKGGFETAEAAHAFAVGIIEQCKTDPTAVQSIQKRTYGESKKKKRQRLARPGPPGYVSRAVGGTHE